MAAPPAAITSFAALYARPEADPYGGEYAGVLDTFSVQPGAAGWQQGRVRSTVMGAPDTMCNAYVGLFTDPAHPQGRTRLLHSPKRFPGVMGRPTPYDNNCYAVLGDVVGTVATFVAFPIDSFNAAPQRTIPGTIAAAAALYAVDPNLQILDPVDPAAGGRDEVVPNMIFVPAPYVPLLLERRLTPRQLVEEVLATVDGDGRTTSMAPFVTWCLYAATASAAGAAHSSILMDDVTAPLADAAFLRWSQALINSKLPELAGMGAGAHLAATTRIANIMTNLLTEQRESRRDAQDARDTARAPKTVSEFYKANLTLKLINMCGVDDETTLPDMWSEIAAANGKRDRETIDMAFRDVANGLGLQDMAPIVTPGLAKKLTCLRLAGNNLDDLEEGIHPLVMVIMDHTSSEGETAYNEAMAAAQDYDDMTRGTGTPGLADLQVIKSTKVVIPKTYSLARAMLQAYRVVLLAMLGDTHRVVLGFTRFLTRYVNRENFFVGRLQRADPNLGPGRLLRFVQLLMRAWFQAIWDAPTVADARAVAVPGLEEALEKMVIGDMSWLPELPTKYVREAPPPPPPVTDDDASPQRTTRAQMVVNANYNVRFDEFREFLNSTRMNDIIRRIGPPPNVSRNGRQVPMCASYHLRHNCFSNCSRRADHHPHTTEEDDALHEWCRRASA